MSYGPIIKTALIFALSIPLASFASSPKPRRTAGHSLVSPTYQREKLPDGQWRPERYALGMGKMIDQSDGDDSLSALSVDETAAIIAEALLRENYLPESDPEKTDLLIVINWGKTMPHRDSLGNTGLQGAADAMNTISSLNTQMAAAEPGSTEAAGMRSEMDSSLGQLQTMLIMQDMAERARRKANDHNARLLGFAPNLYDLYSSNPIGGPQRSILDDLVAEIETPRYFVILQAYDFRKLVTDRKKELLWMTRFSIRAKGRKFDEELANMANSASSLFGARSKGLRRGLLPGDIKMGEIEVIDVLEEEEASEQ